MKTGKPVAKPILPVICERIHHYRDRMGMEQKALADLVGVTANSVSNWENGRSRPDVNLLPGICNALNITLYDLFSMDDPTIKYTARQQILVDEFTALTEGHKKAVENLIDTLSQVEAAENCPDLSVLTYNPDYKPMHFDESASVYLIGRVLGILDKASYATAEDISKYEAVHGEE